MLFEKYANLKYKYGRRVFWAKGCYENTVGGNEAKIRKYIQEQEKQDQMSDQLSFKEYEYLFKNITDIDDSPELLTDSRSKKATPSAVDVAHYAPLGAAGIMALIGPFCKPHVQHGVMILAREKADYEFLINSIKTASAA